MFKWVLESLGDLQSLRTHNEFNNIHYYNDKSLKINIKYIFRCLKDNLPWYSIFTADFWLLQVISALTATPTWVLNSLAASLTMLCFVYIYFSSHSLRVSTRTLYRHKQVQNHKKQMLYANFAQIEKIPWNRLLSRWLYLEITKEEKKLRIFFLPVFTSNFSLKSEWQ